MKQKITLNKLNTLKFEINKPCIIFLKGDLWLWKTTFTKHIINNILNNSWNIISPTYTYYNKYDDIFHFDLYRLKTYDEFFAIWGEDIFDNNTWVIIVEWPEIIEKHYFPDIEIFLSHTDYEDEREVEIINRK